MACALRLGANLVLCMQDCLRELFVFTVKQVRACIFPAIFFAVLLLSHQVPLFGIARYDFLFVALFTAQVLLLVTRIETKDEAVVLCLFHLIGLGLELFKTHPAIGSWSYPEAGVLKLGSVPLYSGFMYAAVASYMCQAWRLLDLKLHHYPSYAWSVPLSVAIYLNFFTHHFLLDLRWILIACVIALFSPTSVEFAATGTRRRMPLVAAFVLIGFFVWVAENFSTYLGAWVYPEQVQGWTFVSLSKISSWSLLVIVSFMIVADLKHVKSKQNKPLALVGPEDREAF